MSAGAFENGKYQGDNNMIYPVKVQPETKGLTLMSIANDYPLGDVDLGMIPIRISSGRNSRGIRPRFVTVELTADGTGETAQYKAGTRHRVVVFTSATLNAWELNATGTYLGIACRLVFKSGEASSV